jgi:hypothetical protein
MNFSWNCSRLRKNKSLANIMPQGVHVSSTYLIAAHIFANKFRLK